MISTTDADLQNELEGLKYEIQVAKSKLPDYASRQSNTEKEKALIYCLTRAIELSEGCEICAKENLLTPQYLLTRGLLESLIWVCWITKSNENAQIFSDTARNENKRLARKNLETGTGKVVDKVTNENKTQELLKSEWVKDIRPRLTIGKAAKDVGLDKLYTELYGFLSIFAHGIMIETHANTKDDMVDVLASASVFMECVNLVVKNWITNRKQTPVKDLFAILEQPNLQ